MKELDSVRVQASQAVAKANADGSLERLLVVVQQRAVQLQRIHEMLIVDRKPYLNGGKRIRRFLLFSDILKVFYGILGFILFQNG